VVKGERPQDRLCSSVAFVAVRVCAVGARALAYALVLAAHLARSQPEL
jgi:hypothetical protein